MKTMRITDIMADFLDSIRAYEHESGNAITFDERESSEFVNMYFNGGGKINIEEKEPLFTTEDGVSIYTNSIELFAVNDMFETASSTRFDFDVSRKEGWKLFFHKSNADEYIWRNKRVFSYNDLRSWDINGGTQEEALKVAKERSKE